MMRWIVDASLRFRRLVVAVAAGVLVVGIVQLDTVPKDALPEFGPPTVEVQTEALGLSAAEVEQLITVPLEQDLLVGVAFLDEIHSVSLPGLSSVVMTFEPGTDLLDARQVVQERLTQAVGIGGLPAVAKTPQMIQPLSSTSRVAMVRLTSAELSPIEMSVLSRWVIAPRLLGVPGVANVSIWGNRDRQLQVLVDPQRLQGADVTLSQVVRTAGNALEVSPLSFLEASTPGTGGFIDGQNQRLNIFHEQAISSPEELAQVPIEGAPGTPLTLGDVTDVVEDHQPLIGDAVCGGGEPCLLLVVDRFPGATTSDVSAGVQNALDALGPGLSGLRMDTSVYRPAAHVESSFGVIGWALLAGLVLLLLVLGAAFWDWRRLVVSAAAISVSAAAAVSVLLLRGTTVDLLIAAGLVLGLTAIVHDAATDAQLLAVRVRDRAGNGQLSSRAVVDTVVELRGTFLYAALVVVAAVVPFLLLRGQAGAFLPPVALSYLLAVAASTLVALVLTPVLGLLLLGRPGGAGTAASPVLDRLHRGWDAVAPRLLPRARVVVAATVGIAVLGLVSLPFLHLALQPDLKERDVLVHVDAAPGTSLPRMNELTAQAVEGLRALPGVADATGQVGRAVTSDQIVGVNAGEIWVSVTPGADYDATVAAVARAVADVPGLSSEVLTYTGERVGDVLGGSGNDLAVRVYGENRDVLSAKADEISRLVAGVDGVTDVTLDRPPVEDTMEVEVDLARAREIGIKPGDVRRAAASLLGGITVGNLFDEQKVFDVVVWGAPTVRQDVADVQRLLIDVPGGGRVPLGAVADVRIAPNPTEVRHESVSSYLQVDATVAGRDGDAVSEDVERLLASVDFPLEHHAELVAVADGADLDEEVAALAAALAAVLAAFLLLQAAFGSWRVAALGLLALPLALAGGLLAAWVTGGTVGIGTVGGLLAVLGISARGVLLVVRRLQQLARSSTAGATVDGVLAGTRDCLGPTLVPAVGSAALLVPFVVLGPRPGLEVLHPAAVTVLGGLVTATVVTLLVVPGVYLLLRPGAPRTWAEELHERVPQPRHAPADVERGVTRRIRAVLALPVVLLAGCAGAVTDSYAIEHQPAHLETPADGGHPRVVMEASAVQRLGIATVEVTREASGALVVPATAVFVDTEGTWWVYTSPEEHTYVRQQVEVSHQAGDLTYLAAGPAPGTRVVTVGVAEVAGVEDEVGH